MYRRKNNHSTFSLSGARRGGGRGGARSHHSNRDDLLGLSTSFGGLSLKQPEVIIPLLSPFAFGEVAIAGPHVEVGEAVPKAESIPDNYGSTQNYLKAMQAHTQVEFRASIQEGIAMADRKEESGWLPCAEHKKGDFYVDGSPPKDNPPNRDSNGHNFKTETWSRHVVQFYGEKNLALVVACECSSGDHEAMISLAPAGGFDDARDRSMTLVRSLGYVGSFLREYGSAARLQVRGEGSSALLRTVSAPGRQRQREGYSTTTGSFVPASSIGRLDTSRVPLNAAQREAVMELTGCLDIIVGPPGTGKSTTIFHIIDARVAKGARVLVTSIRNQAVDAVVAKVAAFGILVFGNENRLGTHAREFTIEGRLRNDPELVFWRGVHEAWTRASAKAEAVSWDRLYLPSFPGIGRLVDIVQEGVEASRRLDDITQEDAEASFSPMEYLQLDKKAKKGRAAGRWAFALKAILRVAYENRLAKGTAAQKQTLKELHSLEKWQELVSRGRRRSLQIVSRLENLTRYRLYTTTRVLICTVDSVERMLRNMEEGTKAAALAIGKDAVAGALQLQLDTVIMDEAACVLETAVPVLLTLDVKNLTLVGDHRQLQPFSRLREHEAGRNHSRSLMERAIDAGAQFQFLSTQYRMHPRICEVISDTFYDGELVTANATKLARLSPKPCRWIQVNGGEVRHDRRGYSNPPEAAKVVEQARAALKRHGSKVEVRVITFYNMQKRELERQFEGKSDICHITISSVDACQGSDADVVIVSTVRSDSGQWLSGFMVDPRRVNVALSRAKEECIMVGDKNTLRSAGGAMWRSILAHFAS